MKRRMAIFLVVLCLVLSVPVMVAGKDQTPAQAANGVVQVYAETTLSDGMVYAGVGSAFGVGKIGEETDIFITNRHVVTAANQDGSLTQSQAARYGMTTYVAGEATVDGLVDLALTLDEKER